MAGLLSDVLPFLYQQGDRAKRHLSGLIADPLGSIQQTAGGIVDAGRTQQGLLAQAFANPQRPFQVTNEPALAQASQNALQGPLGFAPAGITAWHGSPHVFDKFDSSKIGTGEGAQAYGHGLYLAEAPDVAKQYAGSLSAARATKPVGNVDLTRAYQNMPTDVPDTLLAARRDFRALKDMGEVAPTDRRDFLEAAKDNITAAQGGALYKVDLPDEAVAKMLDYDAPLSQQSVPLDLFTQAQKRSLESIPSRFGSPEITPDVAANILKGKRGSQAYELLKNEYGAEQASQMMRQAGIPGIKYLDGGSRNAGQGSSNFVVFDDGLLKILERNGQPLR
jgi:hypothetical protein